MNNIWDSVYAKRKDWGKYPPEELIRFFARHFYSSPDRSKVRALDLGCGFGSASWYLAREGFSVTSIDRSRTVLEMLSQRLRQEELELDLLAGEVLELPFKEKSFDVVIDLRCFMCLDWATARSAVAEAHRVLKPGGLFFSITPAVDCYGEGMGRRIEEGVYCDAENGPYSGMGIVRFSREDQLLELYGAFLEANLEYFKRSLGNRQFNETFWIFSGRK